MKWILFVFLHLIHLKSVDGSSIPLEQFPNVVLWFSVLYLGFAQMWWRREKDEGSVWCTCVWFNLYGGKNNIKQELQLAGASSCTCWAQTHPPVEEYFRVSVGKVWLGIHPTEPFYVPLYTKCDLRDINKFCCNTFRNFSKKMSIKKPKRLCSLTCHNGLNGLLTQVTSLSTSMSLSLAAFPSWRWGDWRHSLPYPSFQYGATARRQLA